MVDKAFDGLEYTREAIAREAGLIQLHASDGSAVEANCACIEEKHLLNIIGLASEGVTLADKEQEKRFYVWLADFARQLRVKILNDDFSIPSGGGVCPPCAPCSKTQDAT